MKRKKTAAPFDLHDPLVPEVRGVTGSVSDIVTPNGADDVRSSEF